MPWAAAGNWQILVRNFRHLGVVIELADIQKNSRGKAPRRGSITKFNLPAVACNARSATVDMGAEWGILHQMAKYQEARLSRTFGALADPTRRAILARLRQEPGASVTQLARDLPVKLPGVMKHLNVLAAAGLIERVKSGRVVAVHLAPGPLREATSWLQHYERFWSGSLDKLTRYLEEDVR